MLPDPVRLRYIDCLTAKIKANEYQDVPGPAPVAPSKSKT